MVWNSELTSHALRQYVMAKSVSIPLNLTSFNSLAHELMS